MCPDRRVAPYAGLCRPVGADALRMRLRIGRGRDAHAPRGCAMWAELGERVYAEKQEMMRGNLGEMRRKQGETKIPQSRGACGTRIVFC